MEATNSAKKYFTSQLTSWHTNTNTRSLPWKSEKNPYKIWLSEIILQQTRALQGLPYYVKFTEGYPTIKDMAAAKDEDAFRLWQGLGYYNRCKNMLATARYIATELDGQFPASYEGLLALKGIGPYTAAAIASFAFGLPNAVVDGNVNRVLSRYFGIEEPIDTTEGKKLFAALAQELLDTKDSSAYNQAIMDLGATVCTPRNPLCDECPLQRRCVAYRSLLINLLPIKSKKLVVKNRYFHFVLLRWKDKVWIEKRTGKDIWENLHQPFLIESAEQMDTNELLKHTAFKQQYIQHTDVNYEGFIKQRLTHQLIESRFFTVTLLQKPQMAEHEGFWMGADDLKKTAFPKTIVSFLEKKLYF